MQISAGNGGRVQFHGREWDTDRERERERERGREREREGGRRTDPNSGQKRRNNYVPMTIKECMRSTHCPKLRKQPPSLNVLYLILS